MTGSQDDYYYSTQAMSENYAAMSLQVVEQDICRAIAHAVRFECQTYPRPYKVAMLMQAPYYFQEAQIEAAIAAMDVAPEYADIRQVESSTAVLYLFSEIYDLWQGLWLMRMVRGRAVFRTLEEVAGDVMDRVDSCSHCIRG